MSLGTLSMKTSFTPWAAAFLYASFVATGSVGIETMMLGFLARTVSICETWVAGTKLASVVATILIFSSPKRWVSPVMHFARICTEDTVIRGQPIKAGEKVVMWYPSGNRDEDIFPEPFTFDITRTPNDHIAFGMGEHFCLGSHLARLELYAMFEGLFERLPDLELAGPIHRLRSNLISGIKHMPVRYTPSRTTN